MSVVARIPVFTINITWGDGTGGTTLASATVYTQLVASLGADVSELDIFDGGGKPMILGYGAVSAEVVLMNTPPGGQGSRRVILNKGMRFGIKAASADLPSGGSLIITGYK